MSDAVAAAAPAVKAKKPRAPKGSVKKVIPTHPPTAQMVNAAIRSLKERGGSSLQAIKKYIAATYKIDAEKLAPFIRKYLKKAVTDGKLVQTKGKGAAGSFKLSQAVAKPKVEKKKKVVAVKKPKTPKAKKVAKPKTAAAKKAKSPKKVKKAAVAEKKPKVAAAKKPKTPKKTKAAAKPKTPKVKKAAKPKKPAAKKAAPKKK